MIPKRRKLKQNLKITIVPGKLVKSKNCSKENRNCLKNSQGYSEGQSTLNKSPALTKSMNMDIWVVGTSNQLLVRGSYTETKFSKKRK